MFRGEPDEILAWSEDILTLVATGVEDFLEQKIVISEFSHHLLQPSFMRFRKYNLLRDCMISTFFYLWRCPF